MVGRLFQAIYDFGSGSFSIKLDFNPSNLAS